MKTLNIINSIILIFLLSGCSILGVKEHQFNVDEAKHVATYNLLVLRYCNTANTNYVYVDETGKTSLRNLFVYINDLNEDLTRSKVCFETLTKYNNDVLAKLSK